MRQKGKHVPTPGVVHQDVKNSIGFQISYDITKSDDPFTRYNSLSKPLQKVFSDSFY